MGVQLDKAAANLKRNGLPRITPEAQRECLASFKSKNGNHTGFWKVTSSEETFYQITTKFEDGQIVRKKLLPHELHLLLIAKTRRPKETT